MAQDITVETFAPHVHTTFRIACEGEPFELELTEVEASKQGPPAEGMRHPFTLIFQGPKDRILPEGTYEVESNATGPLAFHVIPIISLGDRQSYQVVFN